MEPILTCEENATCVDCADWSGACHSERRERRLRIIQVACSEACSEFKPKPQTVQLPEVPV